MEVGDPLPAAGGDVVIADRVKQAEAAAAKRIGLCRRSRTNGVPAGQVSLPPRAVNAGAVGQL